MVKNGFGNFPDQKEASRMELEGIYPIVPTPFELDGGIDFSSIERLTDFMAAKGVHGLAILGALGEGHKLDEPERTAVIGKYRQILPKGLGLVVGVRSPATDLAVRMAKSAQDLGADAILLGPPPVQNDAVLSVYYERVSNALNIPVVIHDYPAATGITLSPNLISTIYNASPQTRYIKLEDPPTGPKMDAVKDLTGGKIHIFGALGGLYAFEELDRGAVGIMTGFAYPELLTALYKKYRDGDIDGAAELFYDIVPLNRFEFQPGIGISLRKHILVKRGVFKTAYVRHPGPNADAKTLAHLFRIADHLRKKGYNLSDGG